MLASDMTVVFDVDSTLSDPSHRLHHILPYDSSEEHNKKKDWKAFHAECDKDKPIWWTLNLLLSLYGYGYNIVIMTGRGENNRDVTTTWLQNHGVEFSALLMRPVNDYRPDYEVKLELLANHGLGTENIAFLVDDRANATREFRKAGFNVLQCANGEY